MAEAAPTDKKLKDAIQMKLVETGEYDRCVVAGSASPCAERGLGHRHCKGVMFTAPHCVIAGSRRCCGSG